MAHADSLYTGRDGGAVAWCRYRDVLFPSARSSVRFIPAIGLTGPVCLLPPRAPHARVRATRCVRSCARSPFVVVGALRLLVWVSLRAHDLGCLPIFASPVHVLLCRSWSLSVPSVRDRSATPPSFCPANLLHLGQGACLFSRRRHMPQVVGQFAALRPIFPYQRTPVSQRRYTT